MHRARFGLIPAWLHLSSAFFFFFFHFMGCAAVRVLFQL